MKPLLIASLLAVAAPTASAGDVDFHFGFRNGNVRIGVGVRKDEHRRGRHHGRRPVEVCERTWVRGHYDTVEKRVWIPGCRERVWQPAEYRIRRDRCGHRVRVLVRRAGYRVIETPGRWETHCERIWHPGHWEYTCTNRHHRH